jgi:hypothetical protein
MHCSTMSLHTTCVRDTALVHRSRPYRHPKTPLIAAANHADSLASMDVHFILYVGGAPNPVPRDHGNSKNSEVVALAESREKRSAYRGRPTVTSRLEPVDMQASSIRRHPRESGASGGYRTEYLRLEAKGKCATNKHSDSRLDSDPSLHGRPPTSRNPSLTSYRSAVAVASVLGASLLDVPISFWDRHSRQHLLYDGAGRTFYR